jgi:hypothetical protein
MNTTISRIALAAPVTAAILGWSIGAAAAAPFDSSDEIQMQQAENNWGPDDIAEVDPEDVDEPEDEPEDEPSDEGADEPVDEDEDAEEESDDESDEESTDWASPGRGHSIPVVRSDTASKSSTAEEPEAERLQTTSTTTAAPSAGPSGVEVPLLLIVGAGAAVTGVAAWAGYRRHRIFAS